MPDSSGRFKGISVPAVPWLEKQVSEQENLTYIGGRVDVSPQMARWLSRDHCEGKASDVYALTGQRTSRCVCGQHDGEIPIAPLLLEDDPDESD